MYRLTISLILFSPGFAQPHPPCAAPNGAGPHSTNLYGSGNPCAFTYSVPDRMEGKLLLDNPQCSMFSRTVVNCSRAVTGNYGQVRLAPGSSGPPAYVVPSTPPPLGVPREQQALAEQLWQRAASLINRDQYRAAMPLLFQCGNLGDRRCQATLGIRFQDGSGVKANDRAAAYWFSAAAAQGHRAAQYALGGMYEEGEGGLPQDLHKATELYIKSANQGFDRAQIALGIQYELGQEVPRSRTKAIELLRASDDQDGKWIAGVLANPRTPARFADPKAFGITWRVCRTQSSPLPGRRPGLLCLMAAERPALCVPSSTRTGSVRAAIPTCTIHFANDAVLQRNCSSCFVCPAAGLWNACLFRHILGISTCRTGILEKVGPAFSPMRSLRI
ncbi:MAG TPA: hypothetical protein VKU01_24540 [Bryobacteraceae bacterium]|nr:hypothetical protein [Bryobacteraceae bacterium]